jgi:DNA-binding transcriptional LysR family regulator
MYKIFFMNYTLHQLQVFLKVTQTKVLQRQQRLHLTQPTVSDSVNFQDQFEIPLTEIIGSSWHVTDFGKEIAIAGTILNEVHAISVIKLLAFKGQLSDVKISSSING